MMFKAFKEKNKQAAYTKIREAVVDLNYVDIINVLIEALSNSITSFEQTVGIDTSGFVELISKELQTRIDRNKNIIEKENDLRKSLGLPTRH